MYILAFETSCDDTSIAIFENDKLLSIFTDSQIKIHNITWWVVPEIAAREHANGIFDVLTNVLNEAKLTLEDIDYIAVTTNPWLLPSILTWTTVASTISIILNKKIIHINHIESHIFANFLDREEIDIKFPLVCLTVSGWHNDIYYIANMWSLEKIGTSWDDSGWEAFDKVAKMMWLWYPWWPIISKLASQHVGANLCVRPNSKNQKELFPRVWLVKKEHNFSFSGLKSSVKREVDKMIKINWELTLEEKKEISYEFENAVTEVLSYKLINAAKEKKVKTVLLSWWVSANNRLKETIKKLAKKEGINFIYPSKNLYCTDNAAMVWINAYYKIKYGKFEDRVWVVRV